MAARTATATPTDRGLLIGWEFWLNQLPVSSFQLESASSFQFSVGSRIPDPGSRTPPIQDLTGCAGSGYTAKTRDDVHHAPDGLPKADEANPQAGGVRERVT